MPGPPDRKTPSELSTEDPYYGSSQTPHTTTTAASHSYGHIPPYQSSRQHTTSISENTTLTEIITIYEKLKSKDPQNEFRLPQSRPLTSIDVELKNIVEETIPIKPVFDLSGTNISTDGCSTLNFNKYQSLELKKYVYFSAEKNVLMSDKLEELAPNYASLLSGKNYWLNIIDPSEFDLTMLFSCFNVHDLTIADIRECYTAEKIEIFKHYTFISMRLFGEQTSYATSPEGYDQSSKMNMDDSSTSSRVPLATPQASPHSPPPSTRNRRSRPPTNVNNKPNSNPGKNAFTGTEDVDFNILIFKDFVITMHNKRWSSIKDILGFLNLLASQASTQLTPDWVLFSVFIELAQDAQCMLDKIEPIINGLRSDKDLGKMSEIMCKIFDVEFQTYSILRFIKPKMNILRMLKNKCGKRLSRVVVCLLTDIFEDFREHMHDLQHFNHILERSQDTFLALVNVEESKQGNEMGTIMKRISIVALWFIPVQAVSGFFGMNVRVPFQFNEDDKSLVPFFSIVVVSLLPILIWFGKWLIDRITERLTKHRRRRQQRRNRRRQYQFPLYHNTSEEEIDGPGGGHGDEDIDTTLTATVVDRNRDSS